MDGGTLHKDNMRAIQMTQFTPRESEKRQKKTTNKMETQPHLPHVSCVANTSQRAASLETVKGGVPTYGVIDTMTLHRKLTQFSIHRYSVFGNRLGAYTLLGVTFRANSRQVGEHESSTFGVVITDMCTCGGGKYITNSTDIDSTAVAECVAVSAHDIFY